MKLVMVGLGKMGGNMAERLRRGGHDVVGYDAYALDRSDTSSLAEAVSALGAGPGRLVWVMVPAGDATQQVVDELAGLLAPGDLVVDGGNSRFTQSIARGASPSVSYATPMLCRVVLSRRRSPSSRSVISDS